MTRYRVLPYRKGSRSAKALAEALGGKRLRLENSNYVMRQSDVIINWGNSTAAISGCRTFNASGVGVVSDKLKFFELVQHSGLSLTPKHWTRKEEIPDEEYPIVCRTVLGGHSGAGIVIAHTPNELVDCQLYVKYEKKKDEYRVHVGARDEEVVVIAVQRKARRLDYTNPDWQVRNHANGFIYQREGFTLPNPVREAAVECLHLTSLDFGAVDVIWNEHKQQAFVLEVNSAPGLEGQTVHDYVRFFKGDE